MKKNFMRYIFIIFTFLISNKILFGQIDQTNFWEPTGQDINGTVLSIVVANNGDIWAGTNNGVYLSTDNGNIWVPKNTGLPTGIRVKAVAINSANGDIFAGTEQGLFRSTDNGNSWAKQINGLGTGSLNVTAILTTTSGIYVVIEIRAGEEEFTGIYYSSDNGITWEKRGDRWFKSLAIGSDGILYGGRLSGGVCRSTNGGDVWTEPSNYTTAIVDALTIIGNSIFAVTDNDAQKTGVLKSTNRGETWSTTNVGLTDFHVKSIVYNPITGHIFIGTYGGAFRSTDLGDSWHKINNGLPPIIGTAGANYSVNIFAVNQEGVMFAGTQGGGVYRSKTFTTPILYTDVDTIKFTAEYGAQPPPSQSFLVTNVSGIGNLSWTATKNQEWFGINPSFANNNNQVVTVSVNSTTTFNPGVSYGNIVITAPNAGEGSSPKNVVIEYTITTPTNPNLGLRTDPADEISFGSIPLRNNTTRTFTIQNVSNSQIIINDFTIGGTNPGDFVLVGDPPPLIYLTPTNRTRTLTIRFTPSALGTREATLTIRHNYPDQSPINITLRGTATEPPKLEIEPSRLNFGDVTIGDPPKELSVKLKNTGNGRITIQGFSLYGTDNVMFMWNWQLSHPPIEAYSESDDLSVSFTPTSVGAKESILIISHDAEKLHDTVWLSGNGVQRDITAVEVLPTSINFGDVQVDLQRETVVRVLNRGNIDIDITQVYIVFYGGNTSFSVSPLSVTIKPDEFVEIPVTFKPESLGAKQATLYIHTASAGTYQVPLTGNGTGTPLISIDSTSINFGNVNVNVSRPINIRITNNGNAPLTISPITIIGDNVFTLLGNPSAIGVPADGGTVPLTVQFLPTENRNYNGTLILSHNAEGSQTSIPLSGRGVSSMIEIDTDIINFGRIEVGNLRQGRVRVTNNGTSQLVISRIIINGTGYDLDGETSRIIVANGWADISVRFSPLATGDHPGLLILEHNADGSPNNIPITLTGIGTKANITIDPLNLNFGNVNVGGLETLSVSVRNSDIMYGIYTDPLVISNISIDGTGYRLLSETSKTIGVNESSYEIRVSFSPTENTTYNGTLTLTHNADGSPHTIQLTGRGVQPIIKIDPTNIDFGNVNVGSPKGLSVTITNEGTAQLDISPSIPPGTGFTLPEESDRAVVLPPNGSTPIRVQFLPIEAKEYNGTLTLTHNANGSPHTIQLTGKGTSSVISLSSNSINFGDINVGVPSPESVRITNSGNTLLDISRVSIEGNGFTLPNNETTISVQGDGGYYDLTVQFSPVLGPGVYDGRLTLTHNAEGSPSIIPLSGRGIASNVRVAIKRYTVKPNETIPISIDAIDDLTGKNVKDFSFTLRYNKRILSYKGITFSNTLSNSHTFDTTGSTHGKLLVKVNNNTETPSSGTGRLIYLNFLGLIGDSCGTPLILESFEFNPDDKDGPSAIPEHGYCELFGRCGGEQTYVTTERDLLYQNNPNPIREGYESTIQYRITTAGQANLTVYDILGREVAKLVNEYKSEGLYSVSFSTKGLPSGVYFYRLRAPGYEGLKKMVIVK